MGRPAYAVFVCSCGERCIMVPHERTGRLAPITVACYPGGNIRVNLASVNGGHGTYGIVPRAERERDPKPRPVSHFANCPHRADFGGRS